MISEGLLKAPFTTCAADEFSFNVAVVNVILSKTN